MTRVAHSTTDWQQPTHRLLEIQGRNPDQYSRVLHCSRWRVKAREEGTFGVSSCSNLGGSNNYKGISLSLEQYKAFLRVIPELNEQLRSEGHDVGSVSAAEAGASAVKREKPQKANIDATSEEEEEEEDDE